MVLQIIVFGLISYACWFWHAIPSRTYLKNLLFYKQECICICHSRWITTANGYLRSLLFNSDLSQNDKLKLQRIASFIISVNLPTFLMIHPKPGASEGPYLTLFQRDLIVAFQEIDPEIVKTTMKYFLEHASQWLSWKNVALSVYAKVAPYSVEAVKACPFPVTVDVCSLLQDRTTRLRHFTMKSKEAPCIAVSHINPNFWKSIHNNNRATERRIGKLKGLINDKITENPSQLNHPTFVCVHFYAKWKRSGYSYVIRSRKYSHCHIGQAIFTWLHKKQTKIKTVIAWGFGLDGFRD